MNCHMESGPNHSSIMWEDFPWEYLHRAHVIPDLSQIMIFPVQKLLVVAALNPVHAFNILYWVPSLCQRTVGDHAYKVD